MLQIARIVGMAVLLSLLQTSGASFFADAVVQPEEIEQKHSPFPGEKLPLFPSTESYTNERMQFLKSLTAIRSDQSGGGAGSARASEIPASQSMESFIKEGVQSLEASKTESLRGPRKLNVYLPDTRETADSDTMSNYPFRCVGRFLDGNGGFCTATIVESNMIVTARRCLGLSSKGKLPSKFFKKASFEAGYSNGVSNYVVQFDYATWTDTDQDTAYLRMVEPLGASLGWVGIIFTNKAYFDTTRDLNYVGYSCDILKEYDMPSYVEDCESKGVEGDNILHDCDTEHGTEGALLLSTLDGLPFALALNAGKDGGIVTGDTFDEWTPENSNYAKEMGYGLDQFLEIRGLPTPAPTPSPTPCDGYQCPDNSVSKKSCPSKFKDCKCDDGFEAENDECVSCSTYQCPNNSSPNPKKECIKKFGNCICDEGYEADSKTEECVPCGYTCPDNSSPKSSSKCPTKFSKCECDIGYEADKNLEECVSCNTFTCPQYSFPNPKKQCITKFGHCECKEGFKKKGDECVET